MTNNFTQSKENVKISQSKIRPILIYFWYLTRLVFTMWSTWVLLIMGLLAGFALNLVPLIFKFGEEAYKFSWLVKTCLSWSLVLVIFIAGLIGVMKTINVFTDSEKDGSDLLIVSKPITRAQIIFTRFLFLFSLAIIYSILNLILFCISLAILDLSNSIFSTAGIKFGMFLAPLLSFMIMGLFSLFLSLKFSSKTARVLPIVMSFGGVISATVLIPVIATFFYSPVEALEKSITNTLSQNEYEFYDENGNKEKARKLKARSTAYKESGLLFIPVLLDKNKKPVQALNLILTIPVNQQIQKTDNKKSEDLDVEDRKVFFAFKEKEISVGANKRKILEVWNEKSSKWSELSPSKWENWSLNDDDFSNNENRVAGAPTKAEYENWIKIKKQQIEKNKNNFIEMKKEIFKKAKMQTFSGNPLFVFLGMINPIYSIISMSGLNSLSPVETTPKPNPETKMQYGTLPEYNYSYKLVDTSQDSLEDLSFVLENRKRLDPIWALALVWSTLAIIASATSIYVYLRKDFK